MPARTLGPEGSGLGVSHRLKKGMSASGTLGPEGGGL